jgi:thymidylate synthase (FAD)
MATAIVGSRIEDARAQIAPRDTPRVELIDSMGDDLRIVNAARVSFGKQSTRELCCPTCNKSQAELHAQPEDTTHIHDLEYRLRDADAGLISYLMRKKHGTPFEMVSFTFRIAAPIRVLREWQRHRIGSFNEMSTRYVEMEPDFFVPAVGDVRVQEGKPGHYRMVDASPELAANVRHIMRDGYAHAWAYYQSLIDTGVAKEIAAYVLPLGMYSEQYWSVNLRSLLNFVALRNHPEALREIRYAAAMVETLASPIVPYAFAAFNNNGRIVP